MHKILLCRHWYYNYFHYYVLHSTIFIINFAVKLFKLFSFSRFRQIFETILKLEEGV